MGLGGAAALAAAALAAVLAALLVAGGTRAFPAQPQGAAQPDAAPSAPPPVRKPRDLKTVAIHYVERRIERPAPRNNEDPLPDDQGLRGAELGVADSNASGRFVGLRFDLKPTVVEPGADIAAAFAEIAAREAPRFVVVNAPAADLLALADSPAAKDVVIFNVSATDTRLRDADCRARVLHVIPSRDMLADALMQFLTFKRWMRILLVAGPSEGDRLYAEAVRRSARKFGLRIVEEKTFDARGADIRDSATDELTLATRGPEHDVVAVADEADEFGDALPYNTASPRPVVGTHGMTPAAWGGPVEAWAAVQLQDRFKKLAGRRMDSVDYSGWMAVHAVGEAAVQLKSADTAAISRLLFDDTFEVGGFKGRALSFRGWNGQLRQPVYLLWPGAVVATAPIEGFLHQRTEMDTLGLDQPESACKAMKGRA
ncbi:ABC transporter substrate-binding protein [Chelatococcus sambhunathii]|uniref:ABC transporter substrate-binding protein n=2 Tax=Chelatococcus sambhunathii TaxID=363953 RepID=A0ABU1DBF1_9HYPH|nr:ABC transporter substrate-binding protein [Chelatococcus sambhunathii]